MSSVVEEFKVAKCRVRHAGVVTRSGCKWAADASVAQAESMLKLRDIIRAPCTGRQGLGTSHFQQWGKAGTSDRRAMIQEDVRNLEEEVKGSGTSFPRSPDQMGPPQEEDHLGRPMETGAVLHLLPAEISVGTNDSNKLAQVGHERGPIVQSLWGEGHTSCPGVKQHSPKEGTGGAMTLGNTLEQERSKRRQPLQKTPATATTRYSLLQKAQSWEMKADLGGRLKFPPVVQTTLRPDVVLWSEEAKKIIFIELTVPWE